MHVSSNIQNTQIQNFKGNQLKNALSFVAPDSQISKGLTKIDTAAFKAYITSLPYRFGVTANEINALKKFDGEQFLFATFDFLGHKLGIPRNIRPQIEVVDNIANSAHMSYLPLYNKLLCNKSTVSKMQQEHVFGLVRHEYQHYLQTVNALRHETFGEEVVEIMVKNNIKMQKKSINVLFENCSLEQIKEIYAENPDTLEYILYIKKAMDNGDEKLVNEIFKFTAQDYRQAIIEYRKNLINELGMIKKDSAMTPKIKHDFKELQELDYYNPEGTVDFTKYKASSIENEALKAQLAAELAFNPDVCGVKQIKDATLNKLRT